MLSRMEKNNPLDRGHPDTYSRSHFLSRIQEECQQKRILLEFTVRIAIYNAQYMLRQEEKGKSLCHIATS